MAKVHVFTITYNEEHMLPYFIKHYRERFPDCIITVFDNESTDMTVQIAEENNCEVISWTSDNQIRDDLYLQIKQNCWKQSFADWVIIVDCDEFLEVNQEILENADFNVIKSEGWDMIGETIDIDQIDSGIRSPGYDKTCCFNLRVVKDIVYAPGCHDAKLQSWDERTIIFNTIPVKLYHFKWIDFNYVIERYKIFNKRLSKINKANNWGIQYTQSEEHHRKWYDTCLQHKIKVRQI